MKVLNSDLKEKNFKRVYLLYGEETFLVNSYKRRFREAIAGDDTMNYNCFEGKGTDIRELISLADTMPFFADRRLIVVDGSGFFKGSCDELADYIPDIPETTTIVFCESEVDKRSRLYKKVSETGHIVEFKRQDHDQLANWAAGLLARDGKRITRSVMDYFLSRTGDDMENIRSEIDKLVSYTEGREVVTKEDIDTIGTPHITSRVFDMVSAIVDGKTAGALELYQDLLTLKEPPMRILFLIARQFNQILQVKDLLEAGNGKALIASKLKVSPYVAGKLIDEARNFTRDQIMSYVTLCVQLEEDVKTGHLDDELAVELLIAGKYGRSKKG